MLIPTKLALAAGSMLLASSAALPLSPATTQPQTLRELRGVPRPQLSAADAVLLIIDAQEEYRSGPLNLEAFGDALAEIARLRAWAHAHGVPVIHVRQISARDSTVFAEGSHGAQIVPELAPLETEEVVDKTLPNAFADTRLEALLAGMGRRQLIVTGFMTHMCLDATTRAAFDRRFTVFIDAAGTAERAIPGPDGRLISAATLMRATLAALNDRFAWVSPTAAVLTAQNHKEHR